MAKTYWKDQTIQTRFKMPAKSKAQQKLMGMVHALQKGELPASKASKTVRRLAKTMSPEKVKHYASTKHSDIEEILKDALRSPEYVQETINDIVRTNTPDYVKGKLIDSFTANLLHKVLGTLSEQNKKELLEYPLNEMVAYSYKILTY